MNASQVSSLSESFPRSLDEGLSGATRVYFIVGHPVAQVKSPAGVTAELRAAGRDAIVVPAHILPADLPAFFACVSSMRNVDGVIATVPHKFSAVAFCATLTDEAAFLGAANTLRRNADGSWHGAMLDGRAMVAALLGAGCEPTGKRVLLVGAGGAGSAIGHALIMAGVASLDIRDNDTARTDALVARLGGLRRATVRRAPDNDDDLDTFDGVVNASPAGMQAGDPLPVDVMRLRAGAFVGDVVTKPPLTPMIEAARARGCPTVTGTQMFEQVSGLIVAFFVEETTVGKTKSR